MVNKILLASLSMIRLCEIDKNVLMDSKLEILVSVKVERFVGCRMKSSNEKDFEKV